LHRENAFAAKRNGVSTTRRIVVNLHARFHGSKIASRRMVCGIAAEVR
jgi:hypothetical protein